MAHQISKVDKVNAMVTLRKLLYILIWETLYKKSKYLSEASWYCRTVYCQDYIKEVAKDKRL